MSGCGHVTMSSTQGEVYFIPLCKINAFMSQIIMLASCSSLFIGNFPLCLSSDMWNEHEDKITNVLKYVTYFCVHFVFGKSH